MNYVVTGGCGYIGSHLARRLAQDGHQVTVVDTEPPVIDADVQRQITYVCQSITYPGTMDMVTANGVDAIFHMAAIPRVQYSVEHPEITHVVNVNGTLNVLEAARGNGVKRVVFASSSSVYGKQDFPMVDETMKPNPLSPYALQKWIGEQYARMYHSLYGLETIALRLFNVYGPGQPQEGDYSLVIPKFMQMRRDGKPLTVYGDGVQTRDFVHVSDVVEAFVASVGVEYSGSVAACMNIGSGVETSVNEIAEMIGGTVEHIIPNPRGSFEEMHKVADISRAERVLGWKPQILLRDWLPGESTP